MTAAMQIDGGAALTLAWVRTAWMTMADGFAARRRHGAWPERTTRCLPT